MKRGHRITLFLIIAIALLTLFLNLPPSLPNASFVLSRLGISKDFSFRKGLDLAGGTTITLRAEMKDIEASKRKTALESTKTVIERRVNFFGVTEPIVQTATVGEDYRVLVELPGITNIEQAVSLVGSTAKLEFREVTQATLSAIPTVETTKPTGLSGADLEDSQASFNQTTGEPIVLFRVKGESQQKFFVTTNRLIGKRMAIVLDEQFVSAPEVKAAIRDNGQISGAFTADEARKLALQLNAGALPVPLSILEQRTIGATLGEESVQKSLLAASIGFTAIVLFMIGLYRKLGVIASVALLIYGFLLLAIFRVIPVTLTLAGIAGFVLSIGMAVDANILIFERMREEVRRNKPVDIALELGFQRAWSSIRDSNVASIITSLILIYFGSGIVRGFAITLLIGVLVSMFSAITVTRTLLRFLYRPSSSREDN